MAALLTYEMGSTDKVVDYIGECREMGIEVLPPDINESFVDFTVVYNEEHDHRKDSGVVRFGLAAVKASVKKRLSRSLPRVKTWGGSRVCFIFARMLICVRSISR